MECVAVVLNINLGQNKELMERCKTLRQYAQFIAAVRKFLTKDMEHQEAVERAVDECIQKDILAEILRKNRNEVVEMILEEWDENEFREFLKEESWNEGREEGKIEGKIETYMEFHLPKCEVIAKIMDDFSLEREVAERYVEKYWK